MALFRSLTLFLVSRRGRRGTRGRARGIRGRRRIVRLAHTIGNVERHGGSLPRRQVAFPPPRPSSQNILSLTLRYEHWVNLKTGEVDDTSLTVSKLAAASKADPFITVFNLYTYYRLKYADVWFVPRHGINTAGDYAIHLVPTPFASRLKYDPTDPSAFDILMNATATDYRKAYQTAKLRYVPLNEREADYRLNPTITQATQDPPKEPEPGDILDDLFHVMVMNSEQGIKDGNSAANAQNLYGRVVIDAHFTFKGPRLIKPSIPTVGSGIPQLSSDKKTIFIGGLAMAFEPYNFDTIIANTRNVQSIVAWYESLVTQEAELAEVVKNGFDRVKAMGEKLVDELRDIYYKIPKCPSSEEEVAPAARPSTQDDVLMKSPSSDSSFEQI